MKTWIKTWKHAIKSFSVKLPWDWGRIPVASNFPLWTKSNFPWKKDSRRSCWEICKRADSAIRREKVEPPLKESKRPKCRQPECRAKYSERGDSWTRKTEPLDFSEPDNSKKKKTSYQININYLLLFMLQNKNNIIRKKKSQHDDDPFEWKKVKAVKLVRSQSIDFLLKLMTFFWVSIFLFPPREDIKKLDICQIKLLCGFFARCLSIRIIRIIFFNGQRR